MQNKDYKDSKNFFFLNLYRVYFISSNLFHLGLPKYHKIIKLKANFVHFIELLTDINKQTYYLLA